MNRCPDCLWSLQHGTAEWFCHNPTVNRERPSFLAGNPQAAVRCYAERQNFVGRCGRAGRLFQARAMPEAGSAASNPAQNIPGIIPDA